MSARAMSVTLLSSLQPPCKRRKSRPCAQSATRPVRRSLSRKSLREKKKKKDQKIAGKKKDENEKSFQPKHYPNHLLQTGTENRSLGI
jgi:hypothetical protein